MWVVYELLLIFTLILYVPSAVWRRRLPHAGWTMRLGRYPAMLRQRLTEGRPIWLHAVSVGEVRAVEPLLQAFAQRYPEERLVLSVTTASGFALAQQRAGEHGAVLYFPLDLRWCVTRTLDAVHPRLLLLMEGELWPTVIRLTKARGIPIAVINGRISPRAFRRYRWVKPWLRGMMDHIDLFLMQSQTDAERLLQLGAPNDKVHVVGSLKWDASLGARPTPEALQAVAARMGLNGSELVIVAGSTHRGEEPSVVQAFTALRTSHTPVRLILAPRHLERLSEVEGLVRHAGLRTVRLSQPSSTDAWDVGVVDTFGQLPVYYGLANAVFVGGSLIPHGGQNPLEAASLGKPVVFGPSMHNFAEITQQLLAHQAARQISRGEELTTVLQEFLIDAAGARAMGQRAQVLTERCRGATLRTLELLKPFLTASVPPT